MDNLELSNYQEKKQKIKTGLIRITQSFVEVGYELKQIRDNELYKLDGYGSITEFAKAEYNLEQWDTSRFIAINDKYADGSRLQDKYEGYKYGILTEMLSLSEDELQLVTLQTTRAEIRELKHAKEEAKEDGHAPAHVTESTDSTQSETNSVDDKNYIIPDGDKLLIEFFREKSRRSILKELAAVLTENITEDDVNKAAEIINPSGYLFFKKGLVVMAFEEKVIKYSNFRGPNKEFTYRDFTHDVLLTFEMSEPDPAVAFYGEPEPDPEPPKKEPEKKEVKDKPKDDQKKTSTKQVNTQSEITKKKPDDNKKETEDQDKNKSDNIIGQMQVEDYPELQLEGKEESNEDHIEVVEADIVEKANQDDTTENESGKLLYSSDNLEIDLYSTGELNIIIKNNSVKSIKKIKAIDSDTGNIWEVAID